MPRKHNIFLIPLILFAAFSLLISGCGNGDNGDNGKECPDGQELNEDGECVDVGRVCELWEPDCCIRTQNPGGMRGFEDCFRLNTTTHTAVCDRPTGTCIHLCNNHNDCRSFYPERCGDGECVCDGGVCPLPACSSHADCGGEGLCVSGECVEGEANPDGCVISPDPVYSRQGETVKLHAYATKGGSYVVPKDSFSWSSANDSVVSVQADTGIAEGGTESSSTVITASVGSASCTVDVTNYGELGAGEARILVLDEVDRNPVVGATVAIVYGADGSDHADTIGTGEVLFSGLSAGAIDIHVFAGNHTGAPNGYTYLSIIGTQERDIIVYLPRNPQTTRGGGIQGKMSKSDFAHISDDTVHVALAGLSIPGNFIDIDMEILLGELIETEINYSSINEVFPLPSGLVIGIDNEFFKDWYGAMGVPGVRTGWMLGGNLSVQEVLNLVTPLLSGGVDDLNIGSLISAILPMFDQFYSGVRPGLNITETDIPLDPGGWPPQGFSQGNLMLTQPLSLKGIINVPTLPRLDGSYLEGAVVIGGVMVEGQGLVPMGLTAGVDTDDPVANPPDGRVNDEGTADDPAVGPGQLGIRLAPQHGGVEGSLYTILSLAITFEDERLPISGLVTTFDSLGFEQEVNFGASAYLDMADETTFNRSTRRFNPNSVSGATFHRASVFGPEARNWVVYHGGSAGFDLVDPSDFGHEDLAADAYIYAQPVMATSGVNLDALFRFNSTNLDDLVEIVNGFSTIRIEINE